MVITTAIHITNSDKAKYSFTFENLELKIVVHVGPKMVGSMLRNMLVASGT